MRGDRICGVTFIEDIKNEIVGEILELSNDDEDVLLSAALSRDELRESGGVDIMSGSWSPCEYFALIHSTFLSL